MGKTGNTTTQTARQANKKLTEIKERTNKVMKKEGKANKTTANSKQERKQADIPTCPGFELPERLTRDEIERLVSRRESEKLNREDPAKVKVAKDRTYLLRLQYILSEAQRRIAEGSSDPMFEKLKGRAISKVELPHCFLIFSYFMKHDGVLLMFHP